MATAGRAEHLQEGRSRDWSGYENQISYQPSGKRSVQRFDRWPAGIRKHSGNGSGRDPEGKPINHVWDPLLDWAKRRKADRARFDEESQSERRVALAADALVTTAARGFLRGVAWAIGIVFFLYLVSQFGHH